MELDFNGDVLSVGLDFNAEVLFVAFGFYYMVLNWIFIVLLIFLYSLE